MSFERFFSSEQRRMAVSNPALVPPLLDAIWAAHSLGTIHAITTPSLGQNNRICFVKTHDGLEYAIRFDTLFALADERQRHHRFGGEAWLFRTLYPQARVPLPRFVALDTSRTIAPCEYLITTRLPGEPLIARWLHMADAERHQLVSAAAEALVALHDTPIAFGRWGNVSDVTADEADGFPSWTAYIENFYRYYADEAARENALPVATLDQLEARFVAVRPALNAVQTPSFVHNDYHWENILYDGDRLTGVVDWEWSVVGDPTLDFKVEAEWERRCPGSTALFMQAYTSFRPFDAAHNERLHFYRLLTHLDDVTAYAGDDPIQHAAAVERLEHELREKR